MKPPQDLNGFLHRSRRKKSAAEHRFAQSRHLPVFMDFPQTPPMKSCNLKRHTPWQDDLAMDSYERLIRVIFWLWKRDWGLSFLLAFASFLIFMPALGGPLEALFEGPVFRTGVYVGTIVFPNSATRGPNGF